VIFDKDLRRLHLSNDDVVLLLVRNMTESITKGEPDVSTWVLPSVDTLTFLHIYLNVVLTIVHSLLSSLI